MEQRKRSSSPIPPNYDNLEPELKKRVEEQIYKQQSIGTWGYSKGDPRLKSSDEIEEEYGDENEE